jgi:hypothetical protein
MLLNFLNDIGELLNTIALPQATWIKSDNASNPPVPQSELLYGYFSISSTEKIMQPYGDPGIFNTLTNKFDFKAYSSIIATISLDLYSFDLEQSAINGMADVLTSFYTPPVEEFLYLKGLGLRTWSNIRNLTALESANVKKREQVDVTFNVIHQVDLEVDRVVSVPIDQNIDVDGEIVTDSYIVEVI